MDPGDQQKESNGVGLADPVAPATRTAGVAADACPSCDAPGSWVLSKRHRFNPFGGVVALVLAIWATLAALLLGVSWVPAGLMTIAGIVVIGARRTALVCQVCGFVEPHG